MFFRSHLLAMEREEDLYDLDGRDIDWLMEKDDIIHLFKLADSYWEHDCTPSQPHLSMSGYHTDGFVHLERALSYQTLTSVIAGQFGMHFFDKITKRGMPLDIAKYWIVSPQEHSAISLAYKIGSHIGCRVDFIDSDLTDKSVGFRALSEIRKQDIVIPVVTCVPPRENLFKIKQTLAALWPEMSGSKTYPRFSPFVFTVLRTDDTSKIDKQEVISLLSCRFSHWTPDECPLCEAGSVSLEFDHEDTWRKLTPKFAK